MPNTPNYGIPYPASTDQIEGTFIQRVADAANSYVKSVTQLTTKGDLPIFSTALTRLPVGGDGTYLMTAGTADAARVSWSGSFSGTYDNALELIATNTSGMSFTSIPSTYSMLVLRGHASGFTGGGTNGIRIRFNSNGGTVYKSSQGFYNQLSQLVDANNASTAVGSAVYWFAGQNPSIPTTMSMSTAAHARSTADGIFFEAYFPEYAGTGGTHKIGYAITSRSNFAMTPDYRGRTSTAGSPAYGIGYLHFAEDIFPASHTGQAIYGGVAGVDTLLNTTSATCYTTVPLVAKAGGSTPQDLWQGSDSKSGDINGTLARHGTNGTVTINLSTTQRPGLMTGDTFVIAGYSGTALGINGTWTAASVTTSGTSIVTYNSGVAGTIAATSFNDGAYLYMTRSLWYSPGTATTGIAHGTAGSTAAFFVGGDLASVLSLSSVRYAEGNTAISSITTTGVTFASGIFKLYGVK